VVHHVLTNDRLCMSMGLPLEIHEWLHSFRSKDEFTYQRQWERFRLDVEKNVDETSGYQQALIKLSPSIGLDVDGQT